MITLNPPHLVLNDSRSNMTLTMTYNIAVRPDDSAGYLINRVRSFGLSSPLENVVFNCHGGPGSLQMGWGFSINQAHLFRRWRNKVKKIWFYACRVARDSNSPCPPNFCAPGTAVSGSAFCAAVARNAKCYVLAGTELQVESIEEVTHGLPPGSLDTFEGMLLSFDPDGNINWFRRYPSTYIDHTGQYHANPS
jgi:hypothetical protein